MPWPFIVLICVVVVATMLHFVLPTGQTRPPDDMSANRSSRDAIIRDDDRYWTAGFLYNNPDDPDLFVPKRYRLGWTVNIGHPLGKPVLIGTLLVPVVLALFGGLRHR